MPIRLLAECFVFGKGGYWGCYSHHPRLENRVWLWTETTGNSRLIFQGGLHFRWLCSPVKLRWCCQKRIMVCDSWGGLHAQGRGDWRREVTDEGPKWAFGTQPLILMIGHSPLDIVLMFDFRPLLTLKLVIAQKLSHMGASEKERVEGSFRAPV